MNKRYFSMYQQDKKADIYIYGDITSWDWSDRDVSSYTLSKKLQELEDVDEINLFINSYGGEVAEGLAIYNSLKRHNATINTYCDGFACSIASVIFMAGNNRYMSDTSLLMIHNAWTRTEGNAEELKKQAEDLETITQASVNAYMKNVNIDEDELKEMMDEETWIDSSEAIEKGFASEIIEVDEKQVANQSIKKNIKKTLMTKKPYKPMAEIKFNKDDLEKIVQKHIDEAMATIKVEEVLEEKPKDENKLNSFMKAFFNTKNEEED